MSSLLLKLESLFIGHILYTRNCAWLLTLKSLDTVFTLKLNTTIYEAIPDP